jgi:hypothetical protein
VKRKERRKVVRIERKYILYILLLDVTFIVFRTCEMEVYNKVWTFRCSQGRRAFIPVQLRALEMKSRWMSCRLNGFYISKPDIAAPSFSENMGNCWNISYSIPLQLLHTTPTFKLRQLGEEHRKRKSLFAGLSS